MDSPSLSFVFVDEGSKHKRLKMTRACSGCRRRKIKCDAVTSNIWPCAACTRLKIVCIPPNWPTCQANTIEGQNTQAKTSPTQPTNFRVSQSQRSPTQPKYSPEQCYFEFSIENPGESVGKNTTALDSPQPYLGHREDLSEFLPPVPVSNCAATQRSLSPCSYSSSLQNSPPPDANTTMSDINPANPPVSISAPAVVSTTGTLPPTLRIVTPLPRLGKSSSHQNLTSPLQPTPLPALHSLCTNLQESDFRQPRDYDACIAYGAATTPPQVASETFLGNSTLPNSSSDVYSEGKTGNWDPARLVTQSDLEFSPCESLSPASSLSSVLTPNINPFDYSPPALPNMLPEPLFKKPSCDTDYYQNPLMAAAGHDWDIELSRVYTLQGLKSRWEGTDAILQYPNTMYEP